MKVPVECTTATGGQFGPVAALLEFDVMVDPAAQQVQFRKVAV